jgi:hypothetical protein
MKGSLADQLNRDAGPMRRLTFAFLALFSPSSLILAIVTGFLSAIDSLEDEELKKLLLEIKD